MPLTSGKKREAGNLPGGKLPCNSQKSGGSHNRDGTRVG